MAKKANQVPVQEDKKTETQKYEAVVYLDKNEVRGYSEELHGPDFEQLAEELHGPDFEQLAKQFCDKNSTPDIQYTIENEPIKEGIKCPACGHIFTL
ncbi:MAG: hypothetical protein ACOYKD_00455 [Anaerolineaceae bacterium]|jgi:hypothetical protein